MVNSVVALDAGPLGLVTNPRRSPESLACARWLQGLVAGGSRVVLPEIADYEVRRELVRDRRVQGLQRLDALVDLVEYLPLTTAAMRQAAEFWAESADGIVATTNVGHLSRYVHAALWRDIGSDS